MAGRSRQPWTDFPIEPCLLLIGIVHGHKRPKAVRAHVTGHDQEIAWRDVRQEPVLIAECNNSHVRRWLEPASLTSPRRAFE